MRQRRSDRDVTNSAECTDCEAGAAKVLRIYLDLYQKACADSLDRPFRDFAAIHRCGRSEGTSDAPYRL